MNLINGQMLRTMVISGAANLSNQRKLVDDLNVFPVPDGDTGTNMNMTFSSAADALKRSEAATVTEVADIVANATIRGARGNSGVILSQLFRGISRSVKGKESIDAQELAQAFVLGSETAYKAVMKPTEGTILTVSREGAQAGVEAAADGDAVKVMEAVVKGSRVSLDKTPEILPVLKQAGVVDSGGMGLYIIFEGFLLALEGKPVEKLEQDAPEAVGSGASAQAVINTEDIKFAYCTEFLINNPNKKAKKCKEALTRMGDSMVFVEDEEIIKVHIHTNNPGFVLQEALKVGELSNLKIENMKFQHSELLIQQEAQQPEEEQKPRKTLGIVAVAAGDGIENLFKELGVDELVSGGQSMNPGTDDILDAVAKANADVVYVLPNNKNIILAAQQAADISDSEIIVIPTKSIPQGVSAVLGFSPDVSKEDNEASMLEMVSMVKTCSVTFASRTTNFDGQEINEGDILGLVESKLSTVGSDINDVAMTLIDEAQPEDGQVITLYYGEEVTEEVAASLTNRVTEKYGECDVVCQYGGQPLYYYFIAVEG